MLTIRPHYVTRALLALMIAAFVFTILRPGNAAPGVGEPTPEFDLSDLAGRPVKLSDYRGKIVVLNFWATWCPPCVEEMPSLNRLQQMFANKGVEVLAISVDDDEQALRRFVADHGLKMLIARDPGRNISTKYQTYQFPETYILDREGRLIRKIAGPDNWTSPEMLQFFQGVVSS